LACRHTGKDVWDDAGQRFGLLTETLQVRKAIALAGIKRVGMTIDRGQVQAGEEDLRRRLDAAVAEVRAACPDLYKTRKDGSLATTKTGAPSKSKKVLLARLTTIKDEIEAANPGASLRVELTPKRRELKVATEVWSEHVQLHPFLTAWMEAEELAKLLQFFGHLQTGRVHSHYTTLVRTGRTSCSGPNVQQIPRKGPLRQSFIPSPGHFLLASDYSFIELCTLAAICLRRYGRSALADVIRAGKDPHAYAAARIMMNTSPEEFAAWEHDPARADAYESARQAIKPVTFGVPGSLGATSLASYARRSYGVSMTVEEAKERRERLITEVYPELTDYLAEDVHAVLANTLHAAVDVVRLELGKVHLSCIRKVLEGNPKRIDGMPYEERFIERIWTGLSRANRNPELTDDLQKRNTSKELARKVTQAGVATLTGRVRGRVRYSQARNTPFQGLAADGAALALFALAKEGFRVVGFIHDEVLIELPDEGGYVSKAVVDKIERIMIDEMGKVLGGLPVGVKSTLSTCWSKKAKRIVEGDRFIPWSPPEEKPPPPPPAKGNEPVHNGTIATPPKPPPPPALPPATVAEPSAAPDRSRPKAAPRPGRPKVFSPPLKRHGGKSYLATRIVALMPPHVHYVEPFAGGAAVLLARDPNDPRFFLSNHRDHQGVSEVINDLDGRLTNFWRVIGDVELFARFQRRAEAIPLSRPEFEKALEHEYGKDAVADAVAFFVENRQSRQALGKDFVTHVKSRTRRGMNDHASAWLSAVEGLPAIHERLRRVVVENKPALDIIRDHDGPGALFYADPPYLHETRTATDAYGDFEMTEADHRQLLDALLRCKGKVMLSGYANRLYDTMLAGWTRYEFDLPNNAASGKEKRRMVEVLWCNFGSAGRDGQ
jgi:DNA adenine methylase